MMVSSVRRNKRDVKGGYGRLAAILLLLAVLLPIVMVQPTGAAGDPKSGTILVKELNMRSGPGKHNPPIATLRRGARVLVLSYEGEWVRILFDNQTGFIMNRERYLRIDEPSSEATAFADATDTQHRPADTFNRELEQSQQKVASYSKAESAVITALDETEQALNTARKTVAQLSAELEALAQRMDALQKQYQEIEQRSVRNETYVAGRLAALYKLSWLGKFNVLASADSMFDFFANKRTLEHILAHDETVMADLAKDKADMQALLSQLAARRDEKQAASEDLAHRIETMKIEQAKRESLLKEVRSKKSLQLAAIDALKASVRDLDQTVAAF